MTLCVDCEIVFLFFFFYNFYAHHVFFLACFLYRSVSSLIFTDFCTFRKGRMYDCTTFRRISVHIIRLVISSYSGTSITTGLSVFAQTSSYFQFRFCYVSCLLDVCSLVFVLVFVTYFRKLIALSSVLMNYVFWVGHVESTRCFCVCYSKL